MDEENNQALRLNAYVARGLHGKKLEYKADNSPYDEDCNPFVAFRNHFNHFHQFTSDVVGEQLWAELLPIIDDPKMPKSPFNYWG